MGDSTQCVKVSRHIARMRLRNLQIGHRREGIHLPGRSNPKRHVRWRIGQHASEIDAAPDGCEGRSDIAARIAYPRDRVTGAARILLQQQTAVRGISALRAPPCARRRCNRHRKHDNRRSPDAQNRRG